MDQRVGSIITAGLTLGVTAAVATAGSVPGERTAAQENCALTAEESEPLPSDPIVGETWLDATGLLSQDYDVQLRPPTADPASPEAAVVVGGGIADAQIAVLCLGRRVPDVVGATRSVAQEALAAVGFGVEAQPAESSDDWTVTERLTPPGKLRYLGAPVQIVLTPPTVPVASGPIIVISETVVEPAIDSPTIPTVSTAGRTRVPDGPAATVERSRGAASMQALTIGAGGLAATGVTGLLFVYGRRRRWRRRIHAVTAQERPVSHVHHGRADRTIRVVVDRGTPTEHIRESDA